MEEKISEYEFVIRAIKRLKKPPYKGIHSVATGNHLPVRLSGTRKDAR